jgi:photosystem II stability/assembly factor-like uncharacterized protein
MNRFVLLLVSLTIACVSTRVQAQAFWERAGGMPALDVRVVTGTADGGVLVASDDGNVWRSSDNGTTWSRRTFPMEGAICTALAVAGPDTVLAATESGLFLSPDQGRSWLATSGITGACLHLAVLPGGDAYAATNDTRIFRSTNGGRTWTLVNTFGPALTSLTAEPSGTLLACNLYEVYRSTSNGVSWSLLKRFPTRIGQVLATRSGTLFVRGQSGATLERSTDLGATWTQISPTARPNGDNRIAALGEALDGTLFIGLMNARAEEGGGGVRRSTDGGLTWQDAFDGISAIRDERSAIVTLGFRSDGAVFAGSLAHGLYRSADGIVWERGDRILPLDYDPGNGYPINNLPRSMAALPRGVVYAGTQGLGLFATSDSGRTWRQRTDLVSALRMDAIVRGNAAAYVLSDGNGIWRIDTAGLSRRITPAFTSTTGYALVERSDGTLFSLAAGDLLRRSTDLGATWSIVGDAPQTLGLRTLHADAAGTLHAAASTAAHRSTDGGVTWTSLGTPLPADAPSGPFAVAPDGTAYWCHAVTGGMPPWNVDMYRRRPADTGWTKLQFDMPIPPMLVGGIEIDADGAISLGTGTGVLRSTDRGETWRSMFGLFSAEAAISRAPDGPLYIIGSDGVFRTSSLAALDIAIIARTEYDSLTLDPVTGLVAPDSFRMWARVRNGSAERLDSVWVDVLPASPVHTVTPRSQLVALTLGPGGESPEFEYTVTPATPSKSGLLTLSCSMRSTTLPAPQTIVSVWLPARGRPSFDGTFTADMNPVLWDTLHWRTGGTASPLGDYNVVRLDAHMRIGGAGPARWPRAQLRLPDAVRHEQGDSAIKTLLPAPLQIGDSVHVSWLVRLPNLARDTVLTFLAIMRDDSIGVRDTLLLALAVDGRAARTALRLSVASIPPDTLRYDDVLKDYEGIASQHGSYTVFPLRTVAWNPGTADALYVRLAVRTGADIVADPFITLATDVLAGGDSLIHAIPLRALPDTVWRRTTLCVDLHGANIRDTTVCHELVIAPFPRTVGVAGRDAVPDALQLGVHPHPVAAAASVTWRQPVAGVARIALVDLLGRECALLTDSWHPAGPHTLRLDVRGLASGVYMLVLHIDRRRTAIPLQHLRK